MITVSIILVAYKAKKELFDCLNSIIKSPPKVSYEVIVVDNNKKSIKTKLKKKFPWIQYVKSNTNRGYGAGNNSGAKKALGELLFFLNPDMLVKKESINILINFIQKNSSIAIVSPLLLQKDESIYKIQGSKELTPLRAIVGFSFLNTLFPKNPISQEYFLSKWNKKDIIKVDAVPGSSFVIKKEVFEQVGGFDENFFMFFEEHDLGKRIKKLGYDIYINPDSKVVHLGGRSSKDVKQIKRIFSSSRFLYFKKHYGIFWAYVVEFFLNL